MDHEKDDKGETHFSHGEIGNISDMIKTQQIHAYVNSIIPKAKNIFEAKARLIELIVEREEPYVHTFWEPVDFAMQLLRELGKPEDLLILIDFFETETMKEALARIIKGN